MFRKTLCLAGLCLFLTVSAGARTVTVNPRQALGSALEKATQCNLKDWERIQSAINEGSLTESQAGIAKVHPGLWITSYDLSPGIKVFGHEARKVVDYSTSVDIFMVYLAADADDSGRKLAKRLHMRADAHYDPEIAVISANRIFPNYRYGKILSKGRRDKNGDFLDGEDKSTGIGPAIFNGQHILVINCGIYRGDPG